MARQIKAGPPVIIDDGKTKDLPVLRQVVLLRIAVIGQQPVQAADADIHIVQQRAVPIPKHHIQPRHFRFTPL